MPERPLSGGIDALGRPVSVLLVEDNRDDAYLISRVLTSAPARFEVLHVDRLSIAVEHVAEGRFDVVLLDLGLPEGVGLSTLDDALEQLPGLPIVVLTGLHDEDTGIDALRRGAQDYLFKGQYESGLLVRAVRYAIERYNLTRELRLALERVRTLAGLLPICAWCKRVRDDSGYWTQVESYLSHHSGLEFSHGICPTCARDVHWDAKPDG